jgi:hypothetical protein
LRDLNRSVALASSREADAWTGGGYVEIGLLQRAFIALDDRQNGNDPPGIGLVPAVGYGFEGVGTVKREISNCIDCESQSVVDYHGGQYLRFSSVSLTRAVCLVRRPVASSGSRRAIDTS